MILREILKKIRQIELRTNGFVPGSSPAFRLLWLAAGVEDGQNHDAFGLDQKMNHKGKAAKNHCPPDFTPNFWKPFRVVRDALKRLRNDGAKFMAQPLAQALVISNRIVKFLRSNAAKNETALHWGYLASSRALTSSSEMTSSGWLIWSCKRRSMNSASPGVNSFDSTMPSQRLRHNSICSVSGRARASFKTKSELIKPNLTGIKHFASA